MKTYRILNPNDILQKGDQFKRGNRWLNCNMFFGDTISRISWTVYRRKGAR